MGVAWLVVAAVAVAWGVSHTERSLEGRAVEALASAGVDADVSFSGRDATVRSLRDQSSLDAAAAAVAGVRGVRRVSFEVNLAEPVALTSTTTSPSPAATEATPPSTTITAPPVTTTTTAPPVTTTTVGAATAPWLVAELEQGTLRLAGVIPDAESAARIAGLAELIYAPFVVNELQVDPGAPSAAWVPAAAGAVAVLPLVGEVRLELGPDTASLSGLAPTPERAGQLAGAVAASLGGVVEVDNALEVTGLAPPFFTASAPGDGTVALAGTMPDQAAVDRIVGAAQQAFGAERVVSELVVGEGIDTTFSLFRIPLVFVQFAPIPQWQFQIENDVITGNLRGGATFAFGSAALTPELEALLQTAAGIISRNPTLALRVEGHTDSIGSDSFNQELSEARATSAVNYLIGLGIDPARLTAVGFGETQPIAPNDTDEGRAQNRRVEFAFGPFVPQGDQ